LKKTLRLGNHDTQFTISFSNTICLKILKNILFWATPETAEYTVKMNTVVETWLLGMQLTEAVVKKLVSMQK
jgi:hypothetical protein